MSTISAHPVSPIEFNEDTIRAIFGHEAAEDETIERLKSYYLKTNTFMPNQNQKWNLTFHAVIDVSEANFLKKSKYGKTV